MKKMFKKALAALCAVTMVLCFAACGGDTKTSSGGSDAANATVPGETFDTGMFTVTVPDGWLAVPASDMFDMYDGDNDPTSVTLVKGGKEEWDSLDHAWVRINIYGKEELLSGKSWYDDVKDLDPVSVSGFDFNVYSCNSSGYPYVMLEGTGANNDMAISILTKNDASSIDYEGAEFQTILKSIKVK